MNKYDAFVQRVRAAVTTSQGTTDAALRAALVDGKTSAVPAAAAPYAEKVRQHAWKVTDEDVDALKKAGYSDDQIFEITGSSALGAALFRLERGLTALRQAKR